MSLIFNAPIEEIVKARFSVRTYAEQIVPEDIKRNIRDYIDTLANPFGAEATFRLLESELASNAAKLGTYGVIKGARNYIGASVKDGALALEGLGYEFEKLILYITSLGMGTCWLGGTFKRSEFAKAMSIKDGESFPAISPFGYAAVKKRLTDSLVRFIAKSDTRKDWTELFFRQDFSTPLSAAEAGIYAGPLEMVRLAPSASNKQPWRIVKDQNSCHFYEYQTPGYSKTFGYDIQRIDMGIAACHFHLAAIEKGIEGEFQTLSDPIAGLPENTLYKFSWVPKQIGNGHSDLGLGNITPRSNFVHAYGEAEISGILVRYFTDALKSLKSGDSFGPEELAERVVQAKNEIDLCMP